MEGNKRLPRTVGGEGATDQSTVSTSDSVYSDGFYILGGFDNLDLPLAGDYSTGPPVLRAEERTIQEALPPTVVGSVLATTNPATSSGSYSAAAKPSQMMGAASQPESLGASLPAEEAESSESIAPIASSAEAPNTQEPTSPQSGPAVTGLSQTMAGATQPESLGASISAEEAARNALYAKWLRPLTNPK